ncbi:MAG: hypothetical protein RIR04_629 [Pseudomonadota bacterium]|jgi:hypothetical protein
MSDLNTPESLWLRLLWLVIIAAMMSVAQTLLSLLTVVQLIIMATSKRQPNAEIAAFGKRLGLWLAQAARFQTADSDDKPWPWAPLT